MKEKTNLIRKILRKAAYIRWRRWRNADYTSQTNPIIIVGCARSGTTLMRALLDAHPNICCGPESALFTQRIYLRRARVKELAQRFDMPIEVVESLLKKSGSLTEFIETFFGEYCRRSGKKRWVEKTPRHVLELRFIFKHFPNARVIHMIRDGRDVVCSLRAFLKRKLVDKRIVKLDTWNPLNTCIERWVRAVRAGLQYRHDLRYKEVRYESLVLNTEETLVDVFKFLEEPWDRTVLDFHMVTRGAPKDAFVAKPIFSSSIGRWRKDLSEEDKQLFKRMAGDLLIELGYVSSYDW